MANAFNMTCTSQEIRILCACKTRIFSFGVLQFADAFTNELIKWLYKIANNRLCTFFFGSANQNCDSNVRFFVTLCAHAFAVLAIEIGVCRTHFGLVKTES